MRLEAIVAIDHLDGFDPIVGAEFFQNIESFHHIAIRGIPAVHEIQTSGSEFRFIEEHEELGGPVIQGLG